MSSHDFCFIAAPNLPPEFHPDSLTNAVLLAHLMYADNKKNIVYSSSQQGKNEIITLQSSLQKKKRSADGLCLPIHLKTT